MSSTTRIRIDGDVLLLGAGSVSQCLQPLLLRHLDMTFDRLTVMDGEDKRDQCKQLLAAGARYVRYQLTPDNLARTLDEHLARGDILINLAWGAGTQDMVEWCHDHEVRYLDSCHDHWALPDGPADPAVPTLRAMHRALRTTAARWTSPAPTAIVDHGANPGLVSHWTKVALEDLATAMTTSPEQLPAPLAPTRRALLEKALADGDHARLAMLTGTKAIHISERDTQISHRPKQAGEFVNTWSAEGLHEEATAPAELCWGTHEAAPPPGAVLDEGYLRLPRSGMATRVRSWVPSGGPILGLLIQHGEVVTIGDHLTIRDGDDVRYRPTVHFAYRPCDDALASLHECHANGSTLQPRRRVMTDDITSGMDELGILLLGHDLGGWWTGSQLTIEQTRDLVGAHNATTLQVAASLLAAILHLVRHPDQGLRVPDDLDHREVLAVATPYLGDCPSVRADWAPASGTCRFSDFLAP
ncbi:saccharopine dehydrogenase NADP-binding domain-containing protein [Actinosynnema sp. NPDC023658]|uniref:saccharopine dehydrogenase NADP-binding domain-containing protein n=1 Tax=Actinosynnema sp. NPDC023658 TaxID=3155465 RepID=UPI0033F6DCA0